MIWLARRRTISNSPSASESRWSGTGSPPPSSSWSPEVRAGWIEAARRQENRAWAATLFDAGPAVELIGLLAPGDAEIRLVAACRGRSPFRRRPALPLLGQMLDAGPPAWSVELTVAVADVLASLEPAELRGAGAFMSSLDRAHPAEAERLAAAGARLSDHWQRHIRGAVARITFRQTIEPEFA